MTTPDKSRVFSARVPLKIHLLQRSGGIAAEVLDLREDSEAGFLQLQVESGGTTAERTALSLSSNDRGHLFFDTTLGQLFAWTGSAWQSVTAAGGPPTGVAGGDLSGTYPNPTVAGLQGNPVDATAPSSPGDLLAWDGSQWTPTSADSVVGSVPAIYGSFSDSTIQNFIPGDAFVVQFDTTEASNGVSVVTDPLTSKPTRLTVSESGIYAFTLSPQLVHSGGGTETIIFWLRQNGTNVPRSSSSLEMGNNNNRNLPFIEIILPMAAGQYVEWLFTSATGTSLSLRSYPGVLGPPEIPAIPSVIAGVKRLGA